MISKKTCFNLTPPVPLGVYHFISALPLLLRLLLSVLLNRDNYSLSQSLVWVGPSRLLSPHLGTAETSGPWGGRPAPWRWSRRSDSPWGPWLTFRRAACCGRRQTSAPCWREPEETSNVLAVRLGTPIFNWCALQLRLESTLLVFGRWDRTCFPPGLEEQTPTPGGRYTPRT